MLDQNRFEVKMIAKTSGYEWSSHFALQEQAELYLHHARLPEMSSLYAVVDYNFKRRFSNEQLEAFEKLQNQVLENAERLEKWAAKRSNNSADNCKLFPCEVCGKNDHPTYACCESCNYAMHRCHFCGDDLGHKTEFSVCYIMWNWEENYATLP